MGRFVLVGGLCVAIVSVACGWFPLEADDSGNELKQEAADKFTPPNDAILDDEWMKPPTDATEPKTTIPDPVTEPTTKDDAAESQEGAASNEVDVFTPPTDAIHPDPLLTAPKPVVKKPPTAAASKAASKASPKPVVEQPPASSESIGGVNSDPYKRSSGYYMRFRRFPRFRYR